MDALFLSVLNMSLTASYVIIFVIAIRLFLKKFPKVYSYAFWFAVLFRLICPFSFDSIFSIIPKSVSIPQDIAYSPKPEISSGITVIDSAVNNVLPPPVNPAASANPMQIWLAIGEVVWLIGIAMLFAYSIFTTVKLYRKLRNAKHMEDNIYIVNGFKTPFVFGIVNPKIYLPDHLSESEKSYVLLHEQTHIKRADHIVKLIFFLVTCIHWFNPLVWIAFYLMGEDMELSCDEKVVKQMGSNIKKEYSSSLLSMSTGRRILGGSPIAFGENNTKSRIKNVLNYKKPKFWVIVLLIIIVTAIGFGLMTNPKSDEAVLSDRRPMIMVNGDLYLDTGKEVSVEIDDSAIIGEIGSSVDQSEKPIEEGQTNFGNIGAKYAHFEDNIVVLLNNEWVLFEKENTDISIENNIIYKNENLGFSLKFPKEWEDKYSIEESENYISVFDKQIYDTGQGGLLFTINRTIGEMITQEDMDMEPVATKIILQGNGYTYFYRLPSDVNYPVNDEDLSKHYQEMSEQIDYAVQGITLLGEQRPKAANDGFKVVGSSYFTLEIPSEWDIRPLEYLAIWDIYEGDNQVGSIWMLPYEEVKSENVDDNAIREYLFNEETLRKMNITLIKNYADESIMDKMKISFKFTGGPFNVIDLQSTANLYIAQSCKKVFGTIDSFEIENGKPIAVTVNVMEFIPDSPNDNNPNGFRIEDLKYTETYTLEQGVNVAALAPPNYNSYEMYYMPLLDENFINNYDYKYFYFDFIVGSDGNLLVVLGHYIP